MPGGRVTFHAFNGTSKAAWFFADLEGSIYTMIIPMVVMLPLLDRLGLLGFLQKLSIWAGLLVMYIPAFILVFVFRRNFRVIGERRNFRYLCRWL